jgi:Fe-S cluster assembly iron-binding protein IscA
VELQEHGLRVFLDSFTAHLLQNTQMDYLEEAGTSGFILRGMPEGGCPSCG